MHTLAGDLWVLKLWPSSILNKVEKLFCYTCVLKFSRKADSVRKNKIYLLRFIFLLFSNIIEKYRKSFIMTVSITTKKNRPIQQYKQAASMRFKLFLSGKRCGYFNFPRCSNYFRQWAGPRCQTNVGFWRKWDDNYSLFFSFDLPI